MQGMAPPVQGSGRAAAQASARATHQTGRGLLVVALGLIVLAVLVVLHVRQGMATIAPSEIIDAILRPDGSPQDQVVRHARLPRVAAGIVAGAALGISGVLLQAVTRNPLASASTVGVNAGAYLAVIAATLFAPGLMLFSSPLVAFSGGMLAALVVYALSAGSTATPTRLALAGMAITLGLGSLSSILILFNEYTISGLYFWGSGSLIQRSWTILGDTWYWVVLIGVVSTFFLSRSLDILGLGDEIATSLGQRVGRIRLIATLLGVMAAALAVTIAGAISFVGLISAHLVRLAGVRRHRLLLPAAALWGAVILVGADVVGRAYAGQFNEVPAGIFTALVGAPWMIWLARRVGAMQGAGAQPVPLAQAARPARAWLPWVMALVALAVVSLLALRFGDSHVSWTALIRTLTGDAPNALIRNALIDHRLPRMLVAGMAGMALAVSGLLVQGVVRNPLAAPDLVGITPGASVGAISLLLAMPDLPVGLLPVAAFSGACISFAAVYALSWSRGLNPTRLALVGIAASAAAGAITNLIIIKNPMQLTAALTWLSGSTYARGWNHVAQLAPWLLVLVPLAWLTGRWLDLLALGDDLPQSLGVRLDRTRLAILAIAVGLAAAAVSVVGAIGFIGLLAPHLSRLLIAGKHRWLIPFAALIGATLLIGADAIGRSLMAPDEIPSGLVVAALGTPYFLWLLWRSRSIQARR